MLNQIGLRPIMDVATMQSGGFDDEVCTGTP
jgi:hypothetical protein